MINRNNIAIFFNYKIYLFSSLISNNLYLYNKKNILFLHNLYQKNIAIFFNYKIHLFLFLLSISDNLYLYNMIICERKIICSEQMIWPYYSNSKSFIRFLNYSFADYLNFTSFIARYAIRPGDEARFRPQKCFLRSLGSPGVSRFVPPYNGLPLQDCTRGIYMGWRARTCRLLTTSLSSLRVEVLSSQMESSPVI